MFPIIEIHKENESVFEEKITDTFTKLTQVAYASLGGKYPERIELPMKRGRAAYPAGKYQHTMESFNISKYGSLQLDGFDTILEKVKN